jgi:hypothetical protein
METAYLVELLPFLLPVSTGLAVIGVTVLYAGIAALWGAWKATSLAATGAKSLHAQLQKTKPSVREIRAPSLSPARRTRPMIDSLV